MPQLQALQAIPSLGEELGRALGTGTEQGLSNALQGYQERKKAQSQMTALEGLLGEKLPQGFAHLPEKIQSTLIQDKLFNKLFTGQEQASGMPTQDQSPQSQQQQPQGGVGFSNLSDNSLIRAMANPLYKDAAKAELDRRNIQLKATTGSETRRSEKFLDKIDESRNAVLRSESSLQAAEEALANRNLGFFSRDNLASILNIPGLASPEGAVFNAAAKNFFLADLESAVGRPNQFLEKILQNAIFSNGKSNEANQALLDFYKNQVDLQREKISITDNLEDYYRNRGLPIPGNIGKLVDQQLKSYASKKEKELIDKYKDSTLTSQTNVKKGQPISESIAKDILKQAKGDKDLARRIAKSKGYKLE